MIMKNSPLNFVLILFLLAPLAHLSAQKQLLTGYAIGKYQFGLRNGLAANIDIHVHDDRTGLDYKGTLARNKSVKFEKVVSENTWVECRYSRTSFIQDSAYIANRLSKLSSGIDETEAMFNLLGTLAANMPVTETITYNYYGDEISRTNDGLELTLITIFMMAGAENQRMQREREIRGLIQSFEIYAKMYRASEDGEKNEYSYLFNRRYLQYDIEMHPAYLPATAKLIMGYNWGPLAGNRISDSWSNNHGFRFSTQIAISPEWSWNGNRSQANVFSRMYLSLGTDPIRFFPRFNQQLHIGPEYIDGEVLGPVAVDDTTNRHVRLIVHQYPVGLSFFTLNVKSGFFINLEGGAVYRPKAPFLDFRDRSFFPGTSLTLAQGSVQNVAMLRSEQAFSPYATLKLGFLNMGRWSVGSKFNAGFNLEASIYPVGLSPTENYHLYHIPDPDAAVPVLTKMPMTEPELQNPWNYVIRLGFVHTL